MASCSISNDYSSSNKGKEDKRPAARSDHKDYTDRELILTLHSHFRKNLMSNLQGFYLMDADADKWIGANDIVHLFKDSGFVVSLDRIKTLIRDFTDEEEEKMNVHGYLRFMASAYAHKHDDQ
jgi:hypothetical protein